MCILVQSAQHPPSISDQLCLFVGQALQTKIRCCGLHPSNIANDEVEGVYLTTLGRRSLQWLRSLKAKRIMQDASDENQEAYDMLTYLTKGLVISSEMSLYPYVFNFYLVGKMSC